MTDMIILRQLEENDIEEIVSSFKSIGWNKPASIYEAYIKEQSEGLRSVLVASVDDKFCGYVTLKYQSDYPAFTQAGVPEIADLNVLPDYRNNGIGTALIKACEQLSLERGHPMLGIGVGMTSDYGNAQRL